VLACLYSIRKTLPTDWSSVGSVESHCHACPLFTLVDGRGYILCRMYYIFITDFAVNPPDIIAVTSIVSTKFVIDMVIIIMLV
jgi:hypothetical protein